MSPATNEERLGVLEANQADVRTDIHEMRGEIREIRSDLAARPTWGVAKALALLGSTTSVLLTSTIALILHITIT